MARWRVLHGAGHMASAGQRQRAVNPDAQLAFALFRPEPQPTKSVVHIYDASSSLSLPSLETSSQTSPDICLLGDSAPWQGDSINLLTGTFRGRESLFGFLSLPSSELRPG